MNSSFSAFSDWQMVMPRSGLQRAPQSTSGLNPGFFSQFRGVCTECPNGTKSKRRTGIQTVREYRLPPAAEGAIDALARCRKLTKREREVLILVCCGLKNNVIAAALRISLSAVRRHLRHLHKKTITSDKSELILNLWHSCQACPEITGSRQSSSSRPAKRRRVAPRR